MQALGMTHPERFPDRKVLEQIIANRLSTAQSDPRPMAVVIYPKGDHNGAFAENTPMEPLMQNYRLMYYEAGNEQELVAALRDARRRGDIELLYIGGHGASDRLLLGDDPNDSSQSLDLSDERAFAHLFDVVAPYGSIVLDSCNNAQGGAAANNLAAMVARLAPHANVAAAQAPTSTKTQMSAGSLANPGFTAPALWYPAFGQIGPFAPPAPGNVTIVQGARPSALYPVLPDFSNPPAAGAALNALRAAYASLRRY